MSSYSKVVACREVGRGRGLHGCLLRRGGVRVLIHSKPRLWPAHRQFVAVILYYYILEIRCFFFFFNKA